MFNPLIRQGFQPGASSIIFGKLDVDLGKLWLSCSTQPVSETDRTAAALQQAVLMETELKEAVRLSSSDRKEDLEKLEKDFLYTSSNDDKLSTSIEDEKILSHYRNSIQEVQLENGENHLQFNLPWIEDTGKLKNKPILQLQRKLLSQPDVTFSSILLRFGEKKCGFSK